MIQSKHIVDLNAEDERPKRNRHTAHAQHSCENDVDLKQIRQPRMKQHFPKRRKSINFVMARRAVDVATIREQSEAFASEEHHYDGFALEMPFCWIT